MLANLRGKVCLVTGASRGVGRGVALGLAEAGAAIMLPQSELTSASLAQAVERLLSGDGTRASMADRARARGKPQAAAEIVSNLLTLIR